MSGLVTVSRGKLGNRGVDAENGYIPADIRYSKLNNPVLDCLYTNNLSRTGDVTFTRDGEGVIQDRYGDWQFISNTSFSNIAHPSNDFTGWSDAGNRWSVTSDQNQTSPTASDASHITLDLTVSSGDLFLYKTTDEYVIGNTYTMSFWIRTVSGTITGIEARHVTTNTALTWTPSGTWTQLSHTWIATATTESTGITVIGTSGAVFGLAYIQVESGSTVNDYIPTTVASVTVANTQPPQRQNQNGYLIESAKTNLITYSGDLSNTDWTVSGAALSAYSGSDPFALVDQNTKLTFSTSSTATVTKTATFTNGVSYAVSLFVKLIGGSVSTMTAAIGGGVSASFVPLTSSWVRIDVTCIAGASNNLVLTIISPSQNATVVLSGIQVETGSKSSLIRTDATARARPADSVSVPYKIGRPDEPWTIFFTTFGVGDTSSGYVLSNGLSGSDAFAVYFSPVGSGALLINIGGTAPSFPSTQNREVCLSYNGTAIKLYLDGTYISQVTNTSTVSSIGSILYIGSNGTDALDAQLSGLRIYDSQLTDKEIAYISGEY